MACIVDLDTGQVVPQKGQTNKLFSDLGRVAMPDGSVVFGSTVGHVHPPQYGEPGEAPIRYRIYQEQVVTVGSGSVAIDSEPAYDAQADAVTVTRTLSDPPKSSVIGFADFVDRFTDDEFAAVRNHVNALDTASKRAIYRKIEKSRAKNSVDLSAPSLGAFFDQLIADNVGGIDAARKTAVLTP